MSKTIEESFEFLKSLAYGSHRDKRRLLQNVSNKHLKALSELCLNLIVGNIQLNNQQKTKFKRYKKPIQLLADKNISLKKKKQLINQKGSAGFLLPLASLALPLIADIFTKKLKLFK